MREWDFGKENVETIMTNNTFFLNYKFYDFLITRFSCYFINIFSNF